MPRFLLAGLAAATFFAAAPAPVAARKRLSQTWNAVEMFTEACQDLKELQIEHQFGHRFQVGAFATKEQHKRGKHPDKFEYFDYLHESNTSTYTHNCAEAQATALYECITGMLQVAIKVEHALIPLYLSGWLSTAGCDPSDNTQFAAQELLDISIQEMIHMTGVANVLVSLGGSPSITGEKWLPTYPMKVRWADDITIDIRPFSQPQMDIFRRIEDEVVDDSSGTPRGVGIASAYLHMAGMVKVYCGIVTENPIKNLDKQWQGSFPTAVKTCEEVIDLLLSIGEQGRGASENNAPDCKDKWPYPGCAGILNDKTEPLKSPTELSHLARFGQLVYGKKYDLANDEDPGTEGSKPSGSPIDIDWEGAVQFDENVEVCDYQGHEAAFTASLEFAKLYTSIVDDLHNGFNGDPSIIGGAIARMHSIQPAFCSLAKIPDPRSEVANQAFVVAPTWDYVPDPTAPCTTSTSTSTSTGTSAGTGTAKAKTKGGKGEGQKRGKSAPSNRDATPASREHLTGAVKHLFESLESAGVKPQDHHVQKVEEHLDRLVEEL